jgi:phospholipase/carboxylesterase
MDVVIEHRPESGRVEQLLLLWHGWAQQARALAPLAEALRREFPQAAVVVPQSLLPTERSKRLPMWYSIEGLRDQPDEWPRRVRAVLDPLAAWVRAQQQRYEVSPQATCMGGFSQGGLLALELATRDDGIAGRVLSFGGRFVEAPRQPPRQTTLHFFHGGADAIFQADVVREQVEQIGQLRADTTMDILDGVGHELHPAMIERALFRLRSHVPRRTWDAAMGATGAVGATGTTDAAGAMPPAGE